MLDRLGAAAVAGSAAIALLFAMFPQCAAGPFARLSDDLVSRWLVNVGEARGLFSRLEEVPRFWLWGVGYSAILLVAGGWLARSAA